MPLTRGKTGLLIRQHLGQQEDRIQGRAQLVADIGEKLGFVAVGLLQLPGMLLRRMQMRHVGLGQGGELLAQFLYLPGPLPVEADRLAVAQDPAEPFGQRAAEPLRPGCDPTGHQHDQENHGQDEGEHTPDQGVAEALDGRWVDRAADPQGERFFCEEHGNPDQLSALIILPECQFSGREDLGQAGKVGKGLRFFADRLPGA